MLEVPIPDDFRSQVERIQEIATLPHVMQRILDTVGSDSSSARDLSREIASDPSLTAKLLKIVNSAYYGFHRQVVLLSEAVVVLGFEEVKRISLAISVMDMFGLRGGRDTYRRRLWQHSLDTAAVAELIERRADAGHRGAFTGGLLHDLGHFVLDQHFPAFHEAVRAKQGKTHRVAAAVEREVIGVTHAEIGYWLADRWRLPTVLTDAIRYHPWPSEQDAGARLPAVVHVSEVVAHRHRERGVDDAPHRPVDPTALSCIGYEPADLAALQASAAEQLDTNEDLLVELLGT